MRATRTVFGELLRPRLRTARILVDNSAGAEPLTAPLFQAATPSVHAAVRYPLTVLLPDGTTVDQSAGPPVLVGSAQERYVTLSPGEAIETSAADLSGIHVTVPAGAKLYFEVAWEEVPEDPRQPARCSPLSPLWMPEGGWDTVLDFNTESDLQQLNVYAEGGGEVRVEGGELVLRSGEGHASVERYEAGAAEPYASAAACLRLAGLGPTLEALAEVFFVNACAGGRYTLVELYADAVSMRELQVWLQGGSVKASLPFTRGWVVVAARYDPSSDTLTGSLHYCGTQFHASVTARLSPQACPQPYRGFTLDADSAKGVRELRADWVAWKG